MQQRAGSCACVQSRSNACCVCFVLAFSRIDDHLPSRPLCSQPDGAPLAPLPTSRPGRPSSFYYVSSTQRRLFSLLMLTRHVMIYIPTTIFFFSEIPPIRHFDTFFFSPFDPTPGITQQMDMRRIKKDEIRDISRAPLLAGHVI